MIKTFKEERCNSMDSVKIDIPLSLLSFPTLCILVSSDGNYLNIDRHSKRPDKQLGSGDLYIHTWLVVLASEWPLDARPFEKWPEITPMLNRNRPSSPVYGRLLTQEKSPLFFLNRSIVRGLYKFFFNVPCVFWIVILFFFFWKGM